MLNLMALGRTRRFAPTALNACRFVGADLCVCPIKGARVELFFKHYNLYKNPRLKIKLSLAPFLPFGLPA